MIAEEQKKQKAEEEAKQAALERQIAEREAREKNLVSMIKTEEERKKAELARKETDEAEKKRQTTINNQIDALQKQAATYGMTSGEVAMYTLEQLGANEAQKEAAQIALDDIRTKEVVG